MGNKETKHKRELPPDSPAPSSGEYRVLGPRSHSEIEITVVRSEPLLTAATSAHYEIVRPGSQAKQGKRGRPNPPTEVQVVERYAVGNPDRIEKLRADRTWFSEHRKRLAAEFPNRYLAIIGQEVVDSDASREALTQRIYQRTESAIFVPYTGDEARAEIAKQHSPRVVEH